MPDRPSDRQRPDALDRFAGNDPDVNLLPATEPRGDPMLDLLHHVSAELDYWRDRALQAEEALDAADLDLNAMRLLRRSPRPFHDL